MKIIVFTGPESVGKTTMAQTLATQTNSLWVPEYARMYIENLHQKYTYHDVDRIAHWQYAKYKSIVEEQPKVDYVFFDTYLIITKVWFEEVFEKVPAWVDKAIENSQIDLFLLLQADIEWKEDPVRENAERREYLYLRYKKMIEYYDFRYAEIGGVGEKRMENALREIQKLNVG